jgi:molecular chaperone DnaK (HSP70)|tara:strand:- start:55551 stop:55733 length:183 start_codon:yes stop_codon:yes gene_type:complete
VTTRRATFKQADAARALRAAQSAGLNVTGLKIDPTGAILVTFGDPAHTASDNSFDRIMGR